MIFWIASYPKNGNTWLRSLLSAYYFTKDGNFTNDKILKNVGNLLLSIAICFLWYFNDGINFWAPFFCSKLQKSLLGFSPSMQYLALLLTAAPSAIFLFISSSLVLAALSSSDTASSCGFICSFCSYSSTLCMHSSNSALCCLFFADAYFKFPIC